MGNGGYNFLMQTFWQKFRQDVLDAIYPIHCLECGELREDLPPKRRWLCPVCLQKVQLRTCAEQVCPVCEAKSVGGKTHNSCASRTALDGVWAAAYYEEPVKKLIHHFKFAFFREAGWAATQIILKSLSGAETDGARGEGWDVLNQSQTFLVPIPLHPRRRNWRGFNQSELLAEELAKSFPVTLRKAWLRRIKHTSPQSSLKAAKARRKNVMGAFACEQDEELKGCTVILVDDVSTTLATLEEAAKTLKQAGARKVWAVIVARR